MLFYLNSPLDEEASHIIFWGVGPFIDPKLVFFGESYGARRCWTSATPPFHAPPRRSSESQEKLPPNNRWSDSKETRTSRNFFARRPKKRIGASKLVSFDTPWHPFPPPKQNKTLQEYMNIILGDFFDWNMFEKILMATQKKIGPTWKKPRSWKLAPRNKNNRKTMVILSWPDIPCKTMGPLAFSFIFPPAYWGEKKGRKKHNCPKPTTSKQPGRLHFFPILKQEALPSPLMLSKAFLAAFAALKRFEPRVLWRVDWRGWVCF